MIVEGKKIRDNIRASLKELVQSRVSPPSLILIYVGSNPVIDVFVRLKATFGGTIGVPVEIVRLADSITEAELLGVIAKYAEKTNVGIVVQLPLPAHLMTEKIVNAVPADKDVDVLNEINIQHLKNGESVLLPPVVGAIDAILVFHTVSLVDKQIALIGKGKLVGEPVYFWLRAKGHNPSVLSSASTDFAQIVAMSDIVISGAGVPGLITPDSIKQGVYLLDAGTSETGGYVVGDIDPRCAEKASLYTPVPGGIGPITIAILFKNLLTLTK